VVHGDTDDRADRQRHRRLPVGPDRRVVHPRRRRPLADLARAIAADLLEAAVDDVVHDTAGDGSTSPAPRHGRCRGPRWRKAAAEDANPLIGISDLEAQGGATFPFGAHLAVVEVDTETGHVAWCAMVACDDAGTILNPLIADGQVHGGLAQGIAQALLEEVRYDDDGNPLTANFADYAVVTATELPMFERIQMETPTP
jgi:aerobic carbon-monoxide dehydrogenase large subunit